MATEIAAADRTRATPLELFFGLGIGVAAFLAATAAYPTVAGSSRATTPLKEIS
ncbi:hypothetical protein [Lacisediminihabitans sp.]|uniref:hypothetical protein n=1 Tax=Lacisediminihabitans sp. TaxID=2787631 RepID=UPI00374D8485